MPEYIVFSICLIILSVTGVLKSPCRAVGLSMFEVLYMLLCALALSVFDMTLSVELKVNAGAAVMIFLPALLVEETRENQGGAVAALVLFSSVIALVERSGLVYGSDNGLFSALMAGTSAVLLNESRGCACCIAAGIPVFSRVVGCFINMASVGYSSLEIGPEVLFSQLAALSMAIVIIWIHSLCSIAGADAK